MEFEMQYGNCLFGALILLWSKRKQNPKLLLRFRPESATPHFMVSTENELHHYKVEKDILPWPFCYLFFRGSFQTLDKQKEFLFVNRKNYITWILSLSFFLGVIFAIFFS